MVLSFTLHGPMTRSDRVATLEEAKAQFQDAWKAWAKLEGQNSVAGYDAFTAGNETGTNGDELLAASLAARAAASSRNI